MNINPFDLLRNAEELQRRLAEAQASLGSISVTGSAGGGMVEIRLNGKFEPLSVKIAAETIQAAGPGGQADAELVSELVLVALRDANAKVQAELANRLGAGGLSGMGFPGGQA